MNESMDRVLVDWLREGPEHGPREGLERALAATRRVGQRPGWTFLERWLPMQLTLARTPSLRPILAIVTLALLIVALVATALFIGSQRRQLPAPFGPARNGAVAYSQGGDLFISDALSGGARSLVAGPGQDSHPVFANQGDRVAFVRSGDRAFKVMIVNPDGSGLTEVGERPGVLDRLMWSPDGTRLLVGYTETDYTGLRIAVANADGSGSHELDVGTAADYATWRPDGRQIVFRGIDLKASRPSVFIVQADGTNIRRLDIDAAQDVDFENLAWSPDGAHLSFMSDGSLGGVTGWQITIADIDQAGNLTALHRLKLDKDSSDERAPVWSPDSTQVAFLLEKAVKRQVGIFNADGTGFRVIGPETHVSNILGYTWSPDGKTLSITEFPDAEAARERLRKMWLVDVATGAQTEIKTPVETWQRLAP
jgi:Tol biopolymer transport system component